MLLIDTSVWIAVFRDKSKAKAAKLKAIIANRNYYLPIFTKNIAIAIIISINYYQSFYRFARNQLN